MKFKIFILFILIGSGIICRDVTLDLTQWRQFKRQSVWVYCHRDDVVNGEKVMDIAEKTVPRIVSDLRLTEIEKIMIIITSSEKEFDLFTQGQVPEWGVAAANPMQSIIYLKSPRFARNKMNLEQTVVHELTHILLAMIVRNRKIDSWFDEGFAMVESGDQGIGGRVLLSRSFLTQNEIRLDDIDEVLFFQRSKASLAYQESLTAVEYLIDQYGIEVISRIGLLLGEGKDMNEALLAITGIGFEDFQTRWLEEMKKKYRWYIFMDFPLLLSLSFVVLFLSAFVITRRRVILKREEWSRTLSDEVEENP